MIGSTSSKHGTTTDDCLELGMLLPIFLAGYASVQSEQKPSIAPIKQTFTYKAAGACRIKAALYRPAGDAILPVVFWIHGGALIGGDRNSIRKDQLESYLENGFAVFSID